LSLLIDKFQELKTDALETFEGISDALSAGDIGLAMKILWLTLQMEWQKGTGFLLEKWDEFKIGFQQTAVDAFYGVLEIANDVWASMRTAWAGFINWFVTKWRTAQTAIAKAAVDVMAYFDSSIDADDAKKQLDDDLAREQRDRDAEHERNKQGIENDRH